MTIPERSGLLLLLALLAWLIAASVGEPGPPWHVAAVIVVAATVVGVHAVTRRDARLVAAAVLALVVCSAAATGHDAVNTLRGPLGYANASAAFYVIGVGAGCLVAVRAKSSLGRASSALLAVALAALPFLAGSRAAALGAVVIVVATVVVWIRPRSRNALITLAGVGTLLVFIATVIAGASYVDVGGDPAEGLLTQRRLALWSEALDLIAAEPVFGVGVGGFAANAPTAIADADARWAHAELLELGVEAGVPALLAGLGLLMWAFAWLYRGTSRRGAAVAAATLAASSAQAHIDYVWHYPAVLLALAAVVGAGTTSRRSPPTPVDPSTARVTLSSVPWSG